MLSPELVDHLKREEERRRREAELPELRIPVDQPIERIPEEARPEEKPLGSTVVVVNLSHDDTEEFTVASW